MDPSGPQITLRDLPSLAGSGVKSPGLTHVLWSKVLKGGLYRGLNRGRL